VGCRRPIPDRKGGSYRPSPGTGQERTMSQLNKNCQNLAFFLLLSAAELLLLFHNKKAPESLNRSRGQSLLRHVAKLSTEMVDFWLWRAMGRVGYTASDVSLQ
jgi:hypothetical protein